MLSVVLFTEISSLVGIGLLLCFPFPRILVLGLGFLLPANLIKALSEKKDIREHGFSVKGLIDLLSHIVKVESEDLVYFHGSAVAI